MMRGSVVLTADRAWPGHGLWLKGTGLGCRGSFCWADPSLQCYCCCCCCSGWVAPWGTTMGQQVAGTGREILGWIHVQAGWLLNDIAVFHCPVWLKMSSLFDFCNRVWSEVCFWCQGVPEHPEVHLYITAAKWKVEPPEVSRSKIFREC